MRSLGHVLLLATFARPSRTDDVAAAWVLEELLSRPLHSAHVAKLLESAAARQLAPFAGGIDQAQLNMLYLFDKKLGHGLLRIRILGRRVFVRKLLGARVRGDLWSDRQLKFLEGVLSVVEMEQVVDVDFVVSLLDTPMCEYFANNLAMPVFVFAQKPDCQNILVPDHSLMQDEYQHGAFGSAFHWSAIVGKAMGQPWNQRRAGIFWDGGFGKFHRRGVSALRPSLVVSESKVQKHWNMDVYKSPSDHCSYKQSLNAQGNTWSMRLKNIFLCGAAAVWFQPHPTQRYAEYWYDLLEEGKHYVGIGEDTALADLQRVHALKDQELRAIAQRGFNYTAGLLRPAAVRRYLAALLQQYAALQRFRPSAVHATDYADFQEVTRQSIAVVQAQSQALSAQHFHFHYAETSDVSERAVAAALERRNLDELPCFGTVRCVVRCCKPGNRWRYSLGPHSEAVGDLHPFCVAPGSDPARTWRYCCEATIARMDDLFRLALWGHPPPKLLEDVDEALLELDFSLSQTISLLETARDAAVHAVLTYDLPNKALWGPGEKRAASTLEPGISRAWFYEEVLKAVCTTRCLSGGCSEIDCREMGTLRLLHQRRQLHRSFATPRQPAALEHFREKGDSAQSLDVLLLLDERNDLALSSLLTNRACALRLHLLVPAGSSTDWVTEMLASRRAEGVTAQTHTPEEAALAVSRHVPVCRQGCDVIFAAAAPHLWLPPEVDFLLFFDISEKDRGPFFVGDVCHLYHDHKDYKDVLLWAPRHIEYARWGHDVLASDVLLFHLDGLRKHALPQLLDGVVDDGAENSTAPLRPVGMFRRFMGIWLKRLHATGLLWNCVCSFLSVFGCYMLLDSIGVRMTVILAI